MWESQYLSNKDSIKNNFWTSPIEACNIVEKKGERK